VSSSGKTQKGSSDLSFELPDLGDVAEAAVVEALQGAVLEVQNGPRQASSWGKLAGLLHDNGWPHEAALAYERAAGLDPQAFEWHYRQGVLLSTSEPRAAVAALEKALHLDEEYAPAQVRFAVLLGELGQAEEAKQHLERAMALDGELVDAPLELGQLLLAEGEVEAAIEILEKGLQLAPKHHQFHAALARACFARGDSDRAQTHAQTARRHTQRLEMVDPRAAPDVEPISSRNLLLHGMQQAGGGELDAALETFRKALETNPDYAEAHCNIGKAYHQLNKPKRAEKALKEALRLNPDYADAHDRLATLYTEERRFEEAIRHAQEALRCDPSNVLSICNLGSLYASTGKKSEAREQFQKALVLDPEAPVVHFNLGILLERADWEAAVAEYEETLRIEPTFWMAHQRLARMYMDRELNERALAHLEEVREIHPDYMEAQLRYGVVLGLLERFEASLEHFRWLREEYPDESSIPENLANSLRKYGSDLLQQGQVKQAIEHFREALVLQPKAADAARSLAWVLATHPDDGVRRGEEALQLAQRALDLGNQEDPVYLDTLAAAHAELGQFERACELAEKAVSLAESQQRVSLHRRLKRRLETCYRESQPVRVKP
jgi:tetratricopeptide (TPR) repeat protein